MPKYIYEGRNLKDNKIIKGEIEADNKNDAILQLKRQQIAVTSIKLDLKTLEIKLPGLGPKVKETDIVVFTRQLATMIDAGLPLVQCLHILGSQADNPLLGKIILKVKEDVETGSTFADALRKHPKTFSTLYVNMIEAGETGGALDNVLSRLSIFMEKAAKLKKQIKSAMAYPIVIVVVAVVVVAALLIFVIPTFAKMFSDYGGKLPALTQMVIDASHFLGSLKGGGSIALFIIVAIFTLKWTYSTKKGRKAMDALFLKLPVFGPVIRKAAVAKFTRTLGTLIQSGVPILEGLDIVSRTAGNVIIEEAILETRESISEGKTIAEPLQKSGVFPPMVVQMISIGETTGALDAMLNKIADFYDEEVDAAVAALTSMLEPMLMVFLGGTVGIIIIAMYLPIFKMASVVG